jgi:hypothetical protein
MYNIYSSKDVQSVVQSKNPVKYAFEKIYLKYSVYFDTTLLAGHSGAVNQEEGGTGVTGDGSKSEGWVRDPRETAVPTRRPAPSPQPHPLVE